MGLNEYAGHLMCALWLSTSFVIGEVIRPPRGLAGHVVKDTPYGKVCASWLKVWD